MELVGSKATVFELPKGTDDDITAQLLEDVSDMGFDVIDM